jgi:hypothetical protein
MIMIFISALLATRALLSPKKNNEGILVGFHLREPTIIVPIEVTLLYPVLLSCLLIKS